MKSIQESKTASKCFVNYIKCEHSSVQTQFGVLEWKYSTSTWRGVRGNSDKVCCAWSLLSDPLFTLANGNVMVRFLDTRTTQHHDEIPPRPQNKSRWFPRWHKFQIDKYVRKNKFWKEKTADLESFVAWEERKPWNAHSSSEIEVLKTFLSVH